MAGGYARMKSFPKKAGSQPEDVADALSASLVLHPEREKEVRRVIDLIRRADTRQALRELKKWEKTQPDWLVGLPGDFARALGEDAPMSATDLFWEEQRRLAGITEAVKKEKDRPLQEIGNHLLDTVSTNERAFQWLADLAREFERNPTFIKQQFLENERVKALAGNELEALQSQSLVIAKHFQQTLSMLERYDEQVKAVAVKIGRG